MKPARFAMPVLIGLLAWVPALWAQTWTFTGTAYSLDNNSPLYEERHTVTIDQGRIQSEVVRYTAPNGAVIAEKHLTYSTLSRPNYRINLEAESRTRTIETDEDGVIITQGQSRERVAWPQDDPAVIDGGFHYFIQSRLDSLKQGNTQRFAFLAPTRADWTPLRINPVERRDDRLILELQLQNRLIRWLVDPIQLTYAADSGRLLTYRGLTNIPRPDGDGNYKARIEYSYPEGFPL